MSIIINEISYVSKGKTLLARKGGLGLVEPLPAIEEGQPAPTQKAKKFEKSAADTPDNYRSSRGNKRILFMSK